MKTLCHLFIVLGVLLCTTGGAAPQGTATAGTPLPDSLRTAICRAAATAPDSADGAMAALLQMLATAPFSVQQQGVDTLLSRAASSSHALPATLMLAAKYLYEPDAPLADDNLMALFAHSPMAEKADLATAARMKAIAEEIAHNAPGTSAPDFSVATPEGATTMSALVSLSPQTVVVFYDPDCTSCHQTTERMRHDPALCSALAAGAMQVVAVNISEYPDTGSPATPGWLYVKSLEPIDEDGRYIINRTPTIIILDDKMTVVRKNPKF